MCEHRKDPGKQVYINWLCRSCTASEKSQKRQIEILRRISEREIKTIRGGNHDRKRLDEHCQVGTY